MAKKTTDTADTNAADKIYFSCEHCNQKLYVRARYADRIARCPLCRARLHIPRTGAAPHAPHRASLDDYRSARLKLRDVFLGSGYLRMAVVVLAAAVVMIYLLRPNGPGKTAAGKPGQQRPHSARTTDAPPKDESAHLLNEAITLTNLTVTPLSVELRKVRGTRENETGTTADFESETPVLVLTLRLTNTAPEAVFAPMTVNTLEGAILVDNNNVPAINYGVFKYDAAKYTIDGQFLAALRPGESATACIMAIHSGVYNKAKHFVWTVPLLTSPRAQYDEFETPRDVVFVKIHFSAGSITRP